EPDARRDILILEERRRGDRRVAREDSAAVAGLQSRGGVANRRLALAVAVADILIVEPYAGGDRHPVVRRPAILQVGRVVLIEGRRGVPAGAVVARFARVDKADAVGIDRGGRRVRDAVRSRLPVDAEVIRIVDVLEAELEVVASGLVRQEVRHLHLALWLRAESRERVPAGAGYRA